MKSIFLATSLGFATSFPLASAQTMPTGSAVSDGIPEFTALLETGIAFQAGDSADVTFPDSGQADYTFTFDNKWLASTGKAVHPGWAGIVAATVIASVTDPGRQSFGQSSGYVANWFWPNGLTGINDFAPDADPTNSGLSYDTIGRGGFSASRNQSTGTGQWVVSFDFTGLAGGVLPAGTLLGFIDTGDDPDGVNAETTILNATLASGAVQTWMTELDYSLRLGYRDQPAPVWRLWGGNTYDLGIETPKLATAGSEWVLMQTTADLEAMVITIDQGPGTGSYGFEIHAPLVIPEAPWSWLVPGGISLCLYRRSRVHGRP